MQKIYRGSEIEILGKVYILAQISEGNASLIRLRNGNRWCDEPLKMTDNYVLSKDIIEYTKHSIKIIKEVI